MEGDHPLVASFPAPAAVRARAAMSPRGGSEGGSGASVAACRPLLETARLEEASPDCRALSPQAVARLAAEEASPDCRDCRVS
ncbi:MAG: hypothetical protein KKB90_12005 [Actinobacteria bacterium]|nr:hypothetical protein [Actinomycetota bacterium]MCG2817538.1 hypothetical protein [Actinomycetes bacterium]MBU4180003.1 hypothetical protein [Actinomycetota bacterium]MBU4219669.1 hypothetical protein [Actinomycetota bacterium]MBU4359726.1 hypothetical protein [Actinomycetota bacterium]